MKSICELNDEKDSNGYNFISGGNRTDGVADYIVCHALRNDNKYWRFVTDTDGEQVNVYAGDLGFIENGLKLLLQSESESFKLNKMPLSGAYGYNRFSSKVLDLITFKELESGTSELSDEHVLVRDFNKSFVEEIKKAQALKDKGKLSELIKQKREFLTGQNK